MILKFANLSDAEKTGEKKYEARKIISTYHLGTVLNKI
jgi:hypothetical protein